MPQLKIGTDDFKKLRREGGYYVDKTPLVREVLDSGTCILLPRPRRFGKTLNLSMLRYFFENSEEDRSDLFTGLDIADDADAMQHQGQYPVIFMSLKDIRGSDWNIARKALVAKIASIYKQNREVAETLAQDDRQQFERLANRGGDRADLNSSLASLITHLYDYYGSPVVVLIDEYDTPVIEAWDKGYYEEMIEFMRCWLGAGLKHENSMALHRAVVTGILRVARESIFSGLNNLATWTTLRSGPFADKFGFTQAEVDGLLADFDANHLRDPIREWYNGYSYGGRTIYNPWSVVNAVQEGEPAMRPHWLNTASNQLVYDELESGGLPVKRDLEKLLKGEDVRYPLSEAITFEDIGHGTQNIWSFLYFSGYLRAEDPEHDLRGRLTYRLSIPNREISMAYTQFVDRVYGRAISDGIKPLMDCFIDDLPAGQLQNVLQELVLSLVSYHDTARQPEAVFHAFVLGLLANLREVYDVQSNAESGYGRADILMRPTTDRYPLGFVIEFKSIEEDADADAALEEAMNQIDERGYAAKLRDAGVAEEDIRKYAVVLCGKDLRVVKGIRREN